MKAALPGLREMRVLWGCSLREERSAGHGDFRLSPAEQAQASAILAGPLVAAEAAVTGRIGMPV